MENTPPTLDELIACAQRELALRKRCFPRWVSQGTMSEEKASREIACMQAICDHLLEAADRREPPLGLSL
jgi:hypothetical protein